MTNLPINYHKFEIQKDAIKRFSENLPKPVELKSVDEKSIHIFGSSFLDHKVTGEEFNSLVKALNKALEDNNEISKMLTKEFGSIYNTFESLDKDYIQGICASIATAKESAKQALEASNQAKDSFEEARSAQAKIEMTTKALRYTVEKYQDRFEEVDFTIRQQDSSIATLSEFINSEIAEQKQLRDKIISGLELYQKQIAEQNRTVLELKDKITADVEAYETKMSEQSKIILELKGKIASFIEHYRAEIEEQNKKFAKLNNKINSYAANYRAKAEEQSRNIAELNRNIYSYAEYYNNKIGEQDRYIDSCVEEYRTKIAEQSQSVTELNSKIDSYAEKFEAQFDTQNKTITELSKFINFNLEQQRLLNNKVASDIKAHQAQLEEQNKTIAKLNNKIKYAYLVSAIAIAIACAHFFMK